MCQGDLNDPGTYRRLARSSGRTGQDGRRPPAIISSILPSPTVSLRPRSPSLAPPGLVTENDGQWRRVVIEKPFGHDLLSAKALNADILKTLQEHQIYRIDHFLGKETVQNIMALRFANGLFEPLWNRAAYRSCPDHGGGDRRRRASRQVLREDRRAARHGAQPRVPAPGHDGDGAADLFRCRCGPRQEDRSHRRRSSRSTRRRRCRDAVRGQYGGGTVLGQKRAAVSRGTARGAEFDDRDFRRLEAQHRQLALGRGAVLSAHRQASEAPLDRNRDPLPSGALLRCFAARMSSRCTPIG